MLGCEAVASLSISENLQNFLILPYCLEKALIIGVQG